MVKVSEIVENKDGNLSPSRYIGTAAPVEHRDIQEILNDLGRLDREAQKLDGELETIFTGMGYTWGGK